MDDESMSNSDFDADSGDESSDVYSYQKEAVVKKRFLKTIVNLVIHGAKTSQVFGRMFTLQNLL